VEGAMPPDVAAKFLPAADYRRAKNLDLAKMAAASDALKKAWLDEVRRGR
jgi:putative spermidine/putrescine transport system substrate-binding protein